MDLEVALFLFDKCDNKSQLDSSQVGTGVTLVCPVILDFMPMDMQQPSSLRRYGVGVILVTVAGEL